MRQAIENSLCVDVRNLFQKFVSDDFFNNIEEIRLRIEKPIIIKNKNTEWSITNDTLTKNILSGYVVTKKNLYETFELITNYSAYAFENEIKNGFITIAGGHRIGLAGKIVSEAGKIKTISNISSLNFRIAHEIKNCAQSIIKYVSNPLANTIIISPPGCGKTTLLRDLIRILSEYYTISVIDERSEIGSCYLGIAQNNLGLHTDILDSCPKTEGMLMALRTMSPQIIAVDEIGTLADARAIENITNSGVKIICTLHGKNLADIKSREFIKSMVNEKIFERYIFLQEIGKISNIYDENLEKIL